MPKKENLRIRVDLDFEPILDLKDERKKLPDMFKTIRKKLL